MIENIDESDIETTLLLFENNNKTSGGPIESHDYDKEIRVLTIVYEDEDVARQVLDRQTISFKEKTFNVKPFKKKVLNKKLDVKETVKEDGM